MLSKYVTEANRLFDGVWEMMGALIDSIEGLLAVYGNHPKIALFCLPVRVGIQWRADNLLFDFQTYPNYQKLTKFSIKSTTAAQILRA